MKKIYGLIGHRLGYSFSKKFFTVKFESEGISDCEYRNFEIDSIEAFQDIFKKHKNIYGLNVTIPYKEQVMQYLDEIDEEAQKVGAINTIKPIPEVNKDLRLKGYNTDIYGFETSLKRVITSNHKHALVLGTGGASKAIKYVLEKLNIEYISASIEELKENEIGYDEIDEKMMKLRTLIIHATPLGTYPNIDSCPVIPYEHIGKGHVLFDLVYNPEETKFMKLGREKGAKAVNGLEMLQLQAIKAWDIWNR
jgi:shikimate dehydrogenase